MHLQHEPIQIHKFENRKYKQDVQVKSMDKKGGGRKFYEKFPSLHKEDCATDSHTSLFRFIDGNVIGRDLLFHGPYGVRKVVYCDYTASGRSLQYIENYIQENVLPHYGNTHTTTSITSLQTTMFRHEARDIIRKCVNASEDDAVIFTGNGCTAAVHKLIHALNFQSPPIVFVSPFEHHSNLLPWKEIGGDIIWTNIDRNGFADIDHLERNLKKYQNSGRPLIGCFAAASNITGILLNTATVAECLHKYNALAFFDYASAGPYIKVDMNPTPHSQSGLEYKDAVFISPHKFVGGPGTPGVLIAKKNLFVNPVPSDGGGGTVFYVTAHSHRYLKEVEMREEGGTPAIVESVRAGLVFQLKENVKSENIEKREKELISMAYKAWNDHPNLIILGPKTFHKIPIFSFVIKHPQSGRLLHHNYVSVLLNDLFGIQSRGGCACAGPYAQALLGMTEDVALQIESLLLEDQRLDRHHLRRYREYSDKEILRPGFTRINLPYFYDDDVISFIFKAVIMVADHGWKLLPFYLFNPETGEWQHKHHHIFKDKIWLGSIKFKDGHVSYPEKVINETGATHDELLNEMETLFSSIKKVVDSGGDQTLLFGDTGEKLRWFLLPCEVEDYLHGDIPKSFANFKMPFFPGKLAGDYEKIDVANKLKIHYCSCSPLFMNAIRRTGIPLEIEDASQMVDKTDAKADESCSIEEPAICQNVDDDNVEKNSTAESTSQGRNRIDGIEGKVDPEMSTEYEENETSIKKESVLTFHNPPKIIFTPTVEAIEEFKMIENNDNILLCLSGGKDSLSMLHIMHQYKFYAQQKGVSFTFGAMTVDPQSSQYDPSPLKEYLKILNVPYFYEEQDIVGAAEQLPVCESICSYCSRMKRGRIYACARREGYNVIALGQHLDDAAESFLMSTFHNGYLRTMKANYVVSAGDLRVIRPMIYIRERELRKFAEKVRLPVIPENCPACFEAPKERHRMKQLLAQQEVLFPNLFKSLRTALRPALSKNKTGIEKRRLDDDERGLNDDERGLNDDDELDF